MAGVLHFVLGAQLGVHPLGLGLQQLALLRDFPSNFNKFISFLNFPSLVLHFAKGLAQSRSHLQIALLVGVLKAGALPNGGHLVELLRNLQHVGRTFRHTALGELFAAGRQWADTVLVGGTVNEIIKIVLII